MFPERKRVEFPGALGHNLVARLDVPSDTPRAMAIFAHCFTCTKDLKAATWISRELVENRVGVLRFDFTGLGESGGDFADTNFTSNLADLVAAADFLRNHYRAPDVLIGHSLGGTASICAARRIAEVRAVTTIAAPAETGHLHEFISRQTPDLGPDDEAEIDVMGRPVRIRGQLLDDLRQYNVADEVRSMGRPLLVFHSPDDEVVDIEHGRRLFDAAADPKSFVALDGTDHLLIEREADARYVARLLVTWVRRYLPDSGA